MALSISAATRKDATAGKSDMTHKHFVTIAVIVKAMPSDEFDLGTIKMVATHFADELKATNPRFDRTRFMIACGYN